MQEGTAAAAVFVNARDRLQAALKGCDEEVLTHAQVQQLVEMRHEVSVQLWNSIETGMLCRWNVFAVSSSRLTADFALHSHRLAGYLATLTRNQTARRRTNCRPTYSEVGVQHCWSTARPVAFPAWCSHLRVAGVRRDDPHLVSQHVSRAPILWNGEVCTQRRQKAAKRTAQKRKPLHRCRYPGRPSARSYV